MSRILILSLLAMLATVTGNTQVPKLNSYPTANATIFLDFDGQTVTSADWTMYTGGKPFYAGAPALLNDQQITTIFNQVSEDFRPFNLNITTDSTVYFAAPLNKRVRIIITDSSAWYGSSAGGVAWVGTFKTGTETPAFVFSKLHNYITKRIAETISHETGHTLGLYHQSRYDANCGFMGEYNSGQGDPSTETSWSPIMGNNLARNLTLWHNGSSNFGCNYLQDDLAIISSTATGSNGFGYRTDDVGNTTVAATNVNFSGQTYGVSGFINNTNDVDYFRVNLTERGRFKANATPYNLSGGYLAANIDIKVSLLNSAGTVLNTYNPSASVQSIIDSVLDAGTYFLTVANTSNANAANYGMLGSYSLSGTFAPANILPVYSLNLSGIVNSNKHELNWNILADEPIESVTVEISADGRTFTSLQELGGSQRKFAYQSFEKGSVYYRLYVITASNLKYYSNIISLKEAKGGGDYKLLTNVVTAGNPITVTSKASYNWKLIDINGRSFGNGTINAGVNRINASKLSSGMYLLQVINGTEMTTEKIIVQ
jgi:Secretion system C-terminal sorting domain/Metallo-peptidase family M12B Reprolysin-like